MNTKELIRKEIERQSTGTQQYSDTEERLMRFKPGVDQKLSLARARMRAHVRTLFLDLCFSVFVFVLLFFFVSLSPSYFKEIHGALGTDLSFYLSSLSIRVIGSMGVVYLHLQVAVDLKTTDLQNAGPCEKQTSCSNKAKRPSSFLYLDKLVDVIY